MPGVPHEIRLLLTLGAAGSLLWCSRRLVRWWQHEDPVARWSDTLLLWHFLMYAVTGALGVLGLLGGWSIVLASAALAAVVGLLPAPRGPVEFELVEPGTPGTSQVFAPQRLPAWTLTLAAGWIVGQLLAILQVQWSTPVLANDPLTYHLPAAVHWIQSGRIGLYETWLHNPANTFSPLAGSVWLAFWLAPMGNDLLARFACWTTLPLIWSAVFTSMRLVGLRGGWSAILATGFLLSRPIISQALVCKDDLYVVAMMAGCLPSLLRTGERWWVSSGRMGVGLGLLLATKFTALLAVPLLGIVAFRSVVRLWSARDWMLCATLVLLAAGPWYGRNIIQTGNPIFPIRLELLGVQVLPGLFRTTGVPELQTLSGAWSTLVTSYFGLQNAPAWILLAGLSLLILADWNRRNRRELTTLPVLWALAGGIGIAVFCGFSPYAESRFALPSYVLLVVGLAGLTGVRPVAGALIVLVLAGSMIWTGFSSSNQAALLPGALLGAVSAVLIRLYGPGLFPDRRRSIIAAVVLAVLIGSWMYMRYPLVISRCRADANVTWSSPIAYGRLGEAWAFVREELPAGRLAYANTHFVYPLMGFEQDRKVFFAIPRPDVRRITDLPRQPAPLDGPRISAVFREAARIPFDPATWESALKWGGADFVLIALVDDQGRLLEPPPPEFIHADQAPHRFEPIFRNDSAAVYRLSR
jgi:hypothetical protein